jgi:hypothetical protein
MKHRILNSSALLWQISLVCRLLVIAICVTSTAAQAITPAHTLTQEETRAKTHAKPSDLAQTAPVKKSSSKFRYAVATVLAAAAAVGGYFILSKPTKTSLTPPLDPINPHPEPINSHQQIAKKVFDFYNLPDSKFFHSKDLSEEPQNVLAFSKLYVSLFKCGVEFKDLTQIMEEFQKLDHPHFSQFHTDYSLEYLRQCFLLTCLQYTTDKLATCFTILHTIGAYHILPEEITALSETVLLKESLHKEKYLISSHTVATTTRCMIPDATEVMRSSTFATHTTALRYIAELPATHALKVILSDRDASTTSRYKNAESDYLTYFFKPDPGAIVFATLAEAMCSHPQRDNAGNIAERLLWLEEYSKAPEKFSDYNSLHTAIVKFIELANPNLSNSVKENLDYLRKDKPCKSVKDYIALTLPISKEKIKNFEQSLKLLEEIQQKISNDVSFSGSNSFAKFIPFKPK